MGRVLKGMATLAVALAFGATAVVGAGLTKAAAQVTVLSAGAVEEGVRRLARDLDIAANVLNLLNAGRGTEYARGGANRQYNTVAYLQPGNLQAARSFQFDVLFRF